MVAEKSNALPWLGLSVVIIVLDWLSKQWALATLEFKTPVQVIDGFWNWTLVHNTGAAFSFLANAGGWQQWLFSGLAVLISGVCIVMLAKAERADWRTASSGAITPLVSTSSTSLSRSVRCSTRALSTW